MKKLILILLLSFPSNTYAAIAYDAVSEGSAGAGTSITWSHTVATNAHVVMVGCIYYQKAVDPGLTSCTYNGATLSISPQSPQIDGNANVQNMYQVYGTVTGDGGAHNVSCSTPSSVDSWTTSFTTYTGASGTLDSSSKTTNFVATTDTTVTTTVVANNSWTIGCFRNEVGGATDGAGTTHRGSNGDHTIADSNGALSAGSQSLIQNFSSSVNMGAIISIAPFTAATSAFQLWPLSLF